MIVKEEEKCIYFFRIKIGLCQVGGGGVKTKSLCQVGRGGMTLTGGCMAICSNYKSFIFARGTSSRCRSTSSPSSVIQT